MLNVVKVQILSFQTPFCDKYFGGMIVYGTYIWKLLIVYICI